MVLETLVAGRELHLLTRCPWRRVAASAVEDVAPEAARKPACQRSTPQAWERTEEQTSHDTSQRELRAAW